MIQANELRIGNLVYQCDLDYDAVGNPIAYHDKDSLVVPINLSVLSDIINTDFTTKYPAYAPIPITPEWLERLGFEWDIYYQGYCDGNYLVNIRENGTISFAYGKRRHDEMQFLPYIKYVHQLQNLYHAITGNELKIK